MQLEKKEEELIYMHTGGGSRSILELKDVVFLFWKATGSRATAEAQEQHRTTDYILLFSAQIYVTESSRGAQIVIPEQGRQGGNSMRQFFRKTPHGLDIILNNFLFFINI